MLHFFLLIPRQQRCLLLDPVPPPITSCGWGKLKQRRVIYNQDWSILAPNPLPVLCLEQLINAFRKTSTAL